jgi:hypothetical protein
MPMCHGYAKHGFQHHDHSRNTAIPAKITRRTDEAPRQIYWLALISNLWRDKEAQHPNPTATCTLQGLSPLQCM